MPVAYDELLSAIKSGDLKSEILRPGDQPVVVLTIKGKEIARLGCLKGDWPKAYVVELGETVEVHASHGLAGGFSIDCGTPFNSEFIEASLNGCFQRAFLDVSESDP